MASDRRHLTLSYDCIVSSKTSPGIIVVYKLPQASRHEIARMLGLTDLKQTRFYQSVGVTIALLESYQPIGQGSMNFRSPISP
ncbi:hypothetical protein HFV01_17175 [Limnospira fusiformis SAG 85.79]|uniref:Rpn family recombination-promoting nuclease/putative transposase n=2 Tax=Limnospira TaxID=2596745 RepID=A0A9P1NYY2_9CYAN|nr:hypothetical protein [Limnospira maxima]EKD05723.1 hypothetical protein SPLC1_S630240 [Arthrospira platensis C1]QJB27196.1 hypothetical protein HFV01_17175 [Limnospira fusiformis SAG 85.79]CDM94442.1 hypothetical protein ARTHRO_12116 [Limnospira indica PCC 8005]